MQRKKTIECVPSRPLADHPRRRVLLLAFQFPPDTGSVQRVTRYVQYLPDFGWDPVVVTRRIDSRAPADTSLLRQLESRAKILRVGPSPFWRRMRARLAPPAEASAGNTAPQTGRNRRGRHSTIRSLLRRCYHASRHWLVWPDTAITWLPSAFVAALRQIATGKVDAIYTVSPPHSVHLVGVALKRLTGVRWVADFRDPWASDPDILMPTRFHRAAHIWAEGLALKTADQLATTTDFHTEYIRGRLPREAASRVRTLSNGYDAAEMADLPAFPGHRFEITHAGGFGYSRQATPLLRALTQLRAHAPEVAEHVFVRFIGTPNPLLVAEVAGFGLQDRVEFADYLPHRRALEELARSAVLLLSVHSDPYVAQISIPAKLFEYMALGRPVLAVSPPGAAAALVDESGCGVVLHPDDIDAIERAIVEYYRRFTRGELHAVCAPEVLQRFERRSLTKALSRLLAGVEPCSRGEEEPVADTRQG